MEDGRNKDTKNTKDTSDAAVIATNDDAFLCKLSTTKCGYYSDKYLAAFAAATGLSTNVNYNTSRPPIINRGTFVRIKLIERLVRTFVTSHSHKSSRCQIVSFGAGYDTLPFRLFSDIDIEGVDYMELDFPKVTRSKMELIDNIHSNCNDIGTNDIGAAISLFKTVRMVTEDSLIAHTVTGSNTYALHGCDLRDLCHDNNNDNTNLMCNMFDLTLPTLFLTECVLMYLPPTSSDALITMCAEYFTSNDNVFVNYEPIRPNDAFGRQMVANISARGSSLLGISKYPTEQSQVHRFVASGWQYTDAINTRRAFERMYRTTKEKLELNRVQIMDELEEWNLIMEHYVVVCARTDKAVAVDSIFSMADNDNKIQ